MMKPIGLGVALAVKNIGKCEYRAPDRNTVNMALVHDAKVTAERRKRLGLGNVTEIADVLAACGRLQQRHVSGRNKNYDHAADEALLRDFLQVQAAA